MKKALQLICLLLPVTFIWAENMPLKSVDAASNIVMGVRGINATFSVKNTNADFDQLNIKVLNKAESYATNTHHTLTLQVENTGKGLQNIKLETELPTTWKKTAISTIERFEANSKKLVLYSFFIPANANPGTATITIFVKDLSHDILLPTPIELNVSTNYELEVFKVSSSQKIQAGETIKASYIVKNKGNIAQKVLLTGKGSIDGETTITLVPGESREVALQQATNDKIYSFRNISTQLTIFSAASEKTYTAFSSTEVFPSKIKRKDPFLRYYMRASLYYNSYTTKKDHYSALSSELIGDGYLDVDKNHYLNFIVRAPEQDRLKRFGVADQYSLVYKYKEKTAVFLGDHAYYINRLGFSSRYGMGFRVDHAIKQWTLSAFYSKPRLYTYNAEPLYCAKIQYNISDSLNLGLAVERSKGTIQGANHNIEANPNEEGQIATFSFNYKNKGTFIEAESSSSITNMHMDYANYINVRQQYKNFGYTGSFTIAGDNYFGSLRNSLQFSNGLNYNLRKINFSIGHTQSMVNRRLDPLFYSAEPFYETFFGAITYRFNQRSSVSIRADKRIREDQLNPKNYFYKEYGGNYRYRYTQSAFSFNFNGRIAQTKNLLIAGDDYRTTFAHSLSTSVRVLRNLTLRGSVNHNYSNRYGNTDNVTNYFRYGFGANYNMSRNVRFNFNYNSGFSPEETYLKRDYINGAIVVKASKNHQFEIRGSYFETPGTLDDKEFLGFGKYTYTFGAPLKRVLAQGGLKGVIYSTDSSISMKGIKIIAAGKTLAADEKGTFEINNLPLGNNYIFIDESTLPLGTVIAEKAPFKVNIEKQGKAALDIQLMRSSTIEGELYTASPKNNVSDVLEGYLQIANEEFTYYVTSDKKGQFQFKNIVPGTYTLSLVRYSGEEYFELEKDIKITVAAGGIMRAKVPVKGKDRIIEFKNKNFKIGN
ncbi:MAG TPA: hypothetical protein ENH91_06815 [Leeuwenhoekiella sp.]|nr:hypothetical protein [Leeuwenhoekiella sp.]